MKDRELIEVLENRIKMLEKKLACFEVYFGIIYELDYRDQSPRFISASKRICNMNGHLMQLGTICGYVLETEHTVPTQWVKAQANPYDSKELEKQI